MRDKLISRKIILLLLLASNVSAQDIDLNQLEKEASNKQVSLQLQDQAKKISLQDAIEEGLRNNFNEKVRSYTFQLNELEIT